MRGIKFSRPKEKDEHRAHELDRTPELADLVLHEMNIAEFDNDLERAREVIADLADLGIKLHGGALDLKRFQPCSRCG